MKSFLLNWFLCAKYLIELSHYQLIKAFHLIAIIAWMCGLLYLPRLFVYHSETKPKSETSETFKIMELLTKKGAHVDYNDPYIPKIKPRREYTQFSGKESVAIDDINQYDITVVLTDHSAYDYVGIVERSKVVVDTRNACGEIKSIKIIKA